MKAEMGLLRETWSAQVRGAGLLVGWMGSVVLAGEGGWKSGVDRVVKGLDENLLRLVLVQVPSEAL